MIDARLIDDLSRTLGKMLPSGVSELKDDFERNTRAAVQGALSNLDVVTREEFDVQAQVLQRTRQRLQALEMRVAALESGGEASASAVEGSTTEEGGRVG